MENDFYWYWFVNIPGVGRVTQKKLLKRFGHPRTLFFAQEKQYGDLLSRKQITSLKQSRDQYRNLIQGGINVNEDVSLYSGKTDGSDHDIHNCYENCFELLKRNHSRFVHWESPDYPEKFRQIFDPPYGIYVRGRLPDVSRPVLAMIGSRAATVYGIQMAEYFAEIFASQGIQIVSGLASGIDAASHRGALQGGGYTLGILGGGIDTIYPRENFNLYWEMYERGGVLSEYNLGIPNHPGLFPERNRLISAISDGVFILEAGKRSGSLITADQALDQGKDIFALPGRITDRLSVGCNHLIAEGAVPVQRPEDVLQVLLSQRFENEYYDSRHKVSLRDYKFVQQQMPKSEQNQVPKTKEEQILKIEQRETSKTGQQQMPIVEQKQASTSKLGLTSVYNPEEDYEKVEDRKIKRHSCSNTFLTGLTFKNPEEKQIYELLDEKNPLSFNDILEKSGYTFVKLQYILLEMELKHWIYQSSQNNYLKKIL